MERLKQELLRLNSLSVIDDYILREYCLTHFFEVSVDNYRYILNYCLKNNIKGIVDIGCAMGYQSELFLNNNIDYIGVDVSSNFFWNNNKFIYIKNKYPFDLSKYKDYLGVSCLCLSWNCYLEEGIKTLEGQFKQLSKDFKRSLIYGQIDNIEYVKKYFKEVNNLNSNFFECISCC